MVKNGRFDGEIKKKKRKKMYSNNSSCNLYTTGIENMI